MSDTICAISTPPGVGGISIVRLSGKDSLKIAKKIFRKFPEKIESHRLYYGHIVYRGEVIDEVLLSVMLSPRSYTREDVVEINCHGGYIIAKKIIEVLVSLGARIAEPGEFTKRAFLNGRIDLVQAEAVVNVINARNETALKILEKQLRGEFRNKIESIKSRLLDALANIEVSIDFEEEVESDTLRAISVIGEVKNDVEKILNSYIHGKAFIEGVNIVIAGAPNVGKSSLLNFFLKKNRAIVSDIPGTTRDTIEESVFFKNFPVKFIDTAGIRETNDKIEMEGVKRSHEKIEEADIVIYLFDATKDIEKKEIEFLDRLKKDKDVIVCANKVDKIKDFKPPTEDIIPISVKERINLEVLETKIAEVLEKKGELSDDGFVITNLRQKQIFQKIYMRLRNALESLSKGFPEMASVDINEALNELSILTGEITTEDMLDRIFSNFCIGK